MSLNSPRLLGVVAALATVHALVLVAAAYVLPWRALSWFAVACVVLALFHVATAVACFAAPASAPRVWRVSSLASLLFTTWWTVTGIAAALTLWRIYGSLGAGLGAALLAALGNIWLFGVPFAVWGLVSTRAARSADAEDDGTMATSPRGFTAKSQTSRSLAGGASFILIAVFGLGALRGGTRVLPASDLQPPLADLVATLQSLPAPAKLDAVEGFSPRLHVVALAPAACRDAPDQTQDATALLLYLDRSGKTRSECVQAPRAQVMEAVRAHLQENAARGPLVLELLVGAAGLGPWSGPIRAESTEVASLPWTALDALVAPFELKPGVDASCLGPYCLPALQLVAENRFLAGAPLAAIPDLRIGYSAPDLIASLSSAKDDGHLARPLMRMTTRAFLITPRASRALDRGRASKANAYPLADPEVAGEQRVRDGQQGADASHAPFTPQELNSATALARQHILRSQGANGKFRYQLDPYSGAIENATLVLPRQAGVTLALCELGGDRRDVNKAVAKSLLFMAAQRANFGSQHALTSRANAKIADLGSSALPLLAFLSCRERVGTVHDDLIAELASFILALQREDGGFSPGWSRSDDSAVAGPDPLFAPGQATFALILLHQLARETEMTGLPSAQDLEQSARRAMRYFGEHYAKHSMADFFFIEENWHCLAARAAVSQLREDSYERFCLDYVTFKRRLLLRKTSRVDAAFVGGYGFGNLVAPQNTPTAGLTESMAAAHSIASARGEPTQGLERDLMLTIDFLLRQQWRKRDLYAVARPRLVIGGWSESIVSPSMRIDFTQHAWAALGHGGAAIAFNEPARPMDAEPETDAPRSQGEAAQDRSRKRKQAGRTAAPNSGTN